MQIEKSKTEKPGMLASCYSMLPPARFQFSVTFDVSHSEYNRLLVALDTCGQGNLVNLISAAVRGDPYVPKAVQWSELGGARKAEIELDHVRQTSGKGGAS